MALLLKKEVALKAIEGKEQIHCFLGNNPSMFIGADWDYDNVKEAIEKSKEVYAAIHPMNHSLCVEHRDTYAYFDVPYKTLEAMQVETV